MKKESGIWQKNSGWSVKHSNLSSSNSANLVLYFFSPQLENPSEQYEYLKEKFPGALITGCSTGGEIYDEEVYDDSLVYLALEMEQTKIKAVEYSVTDIHKSKELGQKIGKDLNEPDLCHLFLLCDGLVVNGTDLIGGVYSEVDKEVITTGGLAGDGSDFNQTFVGLDSTPEKNKIVAIGFYGNAFQVGFGSMGGWSAFGPQRKITKSKDNILYELDGQPALDLYKKYLGEEQSKKLPGSGLLFPLSIVPDETSQNKYVRTIVGIDEDKKSLIFAGDIPEGYIAQLMHASFDNLVDGAVGAAEKATHSIEHDPNSQAAILVSCIGRNLVMGQQIADEAEAIKTVFGNDISMVGFYSYGEIGHHPVTNECGLHNQTMTITLIGEKKAA